MKGVFLYFFRKFCLNFSKKKLFEKKKAILLHCNL